MKNSDHLKKYRAENKLIPKKSRIEIEQDFLNAISKFDEKKQSNWKKIPRSHWGQYTKLLQGKNSNSLRIKLKCLDCSNFQKDEITNCPIFTCSLHKVRPYQKKD